MPFAPRVERLKKREFLFRGQIRIHEQNG
jgi:hypothetical protein